MHPHEGDSAPLGGEESYFYRVEKGAAFNLGHFIDFRSLTTKKVVSISGNNRLHTQ